MSHPKFPRCAVGNRYGRLVVLELITARNAAALCQCDCGEKVTRQRGALVRHKALSCGCMEKEKSKLSVMLKAIAVETDDCIEFPAKANVNGGYGVLRFDGKNERAHRVAYAHSQGLQLSEISNTFIRHTCDNPPCINPRHLVPGTHTENMRDMIERGRARHANGESASRTKLTVEQVIEIKRRAAAGESNPSIAKDYPVSKSQIRAIRSGKSWSHLK